jgi:hypothetical protein
MFYLLKNNLPVKLASQQAQTNSGLVCAGGGGLSPIKNQFCL